MENDYKNLKEFWNSAFATDEVEAVNGKWVTKEKFNKVINTFLHDNDVVLDYGTGSGWGLIELAYTKNIKEGIGIDTSENGVNYANKVSNLSNLNNLNFLVGDETILDNYVKHFNFVFSVNVLDVVPDEIIHSILTKIKESLKPNGYIFIGLNPDFTEDELINLIKMEKKGNFFYKNGILRANKKSIEEWTKLISSYFEVIEQFKFSLTDNEDKYPRVGFICKNVIKKEVKHHKYHESNLTGEDIDMFNEEKYESRTIIDDRE